MSNPFPPELLSAYLDGELSEHEKLFVEKTLREQPEIQEQLTELRSLSERVQGLPRIGAPESLRDDVLAEISRRKSDDQSVTAAAAATEPTNKNLRTLQRSSLTWISSVVALVIVGVGILLLNQQANSPEVANNQTPMDRVVSFDDTTDMTGDASGVGTNLESMDFDTSILMSNGSDQISSSSFQLDSNDLRNESLSDSLSTSSNMALSMQLAESRQPLPKLALLTDELQEQLKSYEEVPVPGEEFTLTATSDGTPVIVDFTVVDVQETLKDVRFLLKKHAAVPLVNQDQLRDQFAGDGELTVIAFDLAEPELEDVLSNVEALQAVRYVTPEVVNGDDFSGNDARGMSIGGGSGEAAVREIELASEPAGDEPRVFMENSLGVESSASVAELEAGAKVEQKFRFVVSGKDLKQLGQLPAIENQPSEAANLRRAANAPKPASASKTQPALPGDSSAPKPAAVAASSGLESGSDSNQSEAIVLEEGLTRSHPFKKDPGRVNSAGQGIDKQSVVPPPASSIELKVKPTTRESVRGTTDPTTSLDEMKQVERKIRAVLLLRQLDE